MLVSRRRFLAEQALTCAVRRRRHPSAEAWIHVAHGPFPALVVGVLVQFGHLHVTTIASVLGSLAVVSLLPSQVGQTAGTTGGVVRGLGGSVLTLTPPVAEPRPFFSVWFETSMANAISEASASLRRSSRERTTSAVAASSKAVRADRTRVCASLILERSNSPRSASTTRS